ITGAVVSARVVLEPGAAETPEAEVRAEILAACRSALSPHKVPALLKVVASLEMTAAGKLARPHA
ncbi:AMP-binding enzyme, partial [Klebsiella aerogenes]